jgi:ABC-type Fe3+-hydroxamate transport system substrate-binding protein
LIKIISLSPSFTGIVQFIGRQQLLCGITDHCAEPFEGIAKIGSPKALNLALIESLQPDVILADQNENRPEELRILEKKFKVVSFDVRSVPSVLEAVRAIGRLAEAVPEAARFSDEITAAKEEAQKAAKEFEPVPVLVLLWNTPYLTINFDTYISRLVELCGGVNVFHSDPLREFPVEMEDMIEKNPGLLLLPKDPFPFKKRHIASFRQYRIFSKIRIELINGKLFSYFGAQTIPAIQHLSSLLADTAAKVNSSAGR